MNQKSLDKMITEVLAIEEENAIEAGALGFMSRALVQATMPHKSVKGNEFVRKNGGFTLTMLAPSDIGLPYGNIPRLLVAWLTTEAVRTKQKELILGHSLSDFMKQLDLVPTGGRWGSITRLKEQTRRLFSATISCSYEDQGQLSIRNMNPVSQATLWWHPTIVNQGSLIESTVTLGKEFYDEIINNPVPIDMRVLKVLKQSSLALDIYCWLVYRLFYLKKRTVIPWPVLAMQFGSDYTRIRDFKKKFIDQLRKVTLIYREANLSTDDNGLTLRPSKCAIPQAVDNPVK